MTLRDVGNAASRRERLLHRDASGLRVFAGKSVGWALAHQGCGVRSGGLKPTLRASLNSGSVAALQALAAAVVQFSTQSSGLNSVPRWLTLGLSPTIRLGHPSQR